MARRLLYALDPPAGSILTIPALPPIPQTRRRAEFCGRNSPGATSLPVVAIESLLASRLCQGGMVARSPLFDNARALPLSEAAGFGALMPIGAVLGSLIAASLMGREFH